MTNVCFTGMTTSDQSESIDLYLDRYVNLNTMLNDFVVQYDKVVADADVKKKTMTFIQ